MKGEVKAKDVVKDKITYAELEQKYIFIKAGQAMGGPAWDELGKAVATMAEHGWRAVCGWDTVVLMEKV